MLCIVGLGNPGRRYHQTRHNIGFAVVDRLGQELGLTWHTIDGRTVQIAEHRLDGTSLLFVKPQQFMNRSGGPVARLMKKYRIALNNLLVIVDDIDLPFGQLRLRPAGSSGGHHGLDSIITHAGGKNFPRLRIGVGPKTKNAGFDGAAYVLHSFTTQERRALPDVIDRAVDALRLGIDRGLPAAMNVWNRPAASRRRP